MSTSTAMTTDRELEGRSDAKRETATVEELSTDRMFHLLQNERRRLTLEYLQGTEGVVDMREIVENVAAVEYDTEPDQLSSTERQRVYIALYQSHLPKLADSGVIEYDQSRGRVSRTELADELDPYLTATATAPEQETDTSRGRHYLSASAGALVVLIAGWLNAIPGWSGATIAGLVVTGLLAIALSHHVVRQ